MTPSSTVSPDTYGTHPVILYTSSEITSHGSRTADCRRSGGLAELPVLPPGLNATSLVRYADAYGPVGWNCPLSGETSVHQQQQCPFGCRTICMIRDLLQLHSDSFRREMLEMSASKIQPSLLQCNGHWPECVLPQRAQGAPKALVTMHKPLKRGLRRRPAVCSSELPSVAWPEQLSRTQSSSPAGPS